MQTTSLGLTAADRELDDRGWVEPVHADEVAASPVPASGWQQGASIRLLSRGAVTGGISGLLELPRGYRRVDGHFPCDVEFFVVSGALRIGTAVRAYGWYEHVPAGAHQDGWIAAEPCEVFFRSSRTPDLINEPGPGSDRPAVAIDTDAVAWTPGSIPGQAQLVLRHDDETGERAWLMKAAPRHVGPGLEYHSCIEETFCVAGSVWLGNAGTLRRGSYLWRPPFISHGPPYSETGMVLWAWASSHFGHNPPLRFDASAEENHADFRRRQIADHETQAQ